MDDKSWVKFPAWPWCSLEGFLPTAIHLDSHRELPRYFLSFLFRDTPGILSTLVFPMKAREGERNWVAVGLALRLASLEAMAKSLSCSKPQLGRAGEARVVSYFMYSCVPSAYM